MGTTQSGLTLFWRRLKMMLIGIIAPELMVGFAARQFLGAQTLLKAGSPDLELLKFGALIQISSTEYGFSRTHGYFFCMGGFVSSTGYPIVTKKQLDDPTLGPDFLEGIKKIRVRDIMDKSKGDALSKGVTLVQGLWFATQCLARLHQHLAITELEVATLAFAVVNILIWLLWWDKPLDVQEPMVVGPPTLLDAQPLTPFPLSRWYRVGYAIIGTDENDSYDPLSSTSVPSFWSLAMDSKLLYGIGIITALAGSVFGAIPRGSNSPVISFSLILGPPCAIHCAAWNIDFPTAAEMWIWRSGSLVVATIPVVTFLVLHLSFIINEHAFENPMLGDAITIIAIVFWGSFPIYIAARLILIVLPLAALRSLPPSAFMDVNWSTYIPHI
ncbi:hypothetical protein MVEN_00933300 [Mycena venus]|uniref:Uncharacterized protein n=1 Tax=Mycena venus TaxID=2733690 RepID=A0A8H7D1W1_9AGAR|nr:hypothetical protein MVEN_00933300 [Mycena venus]